MVCTNTTRLLNASVCSSPACTVVRSCTCDLATEYNVTVRTLQRDFNQRLSYLPIEHRNQQYWLDPGFLNHKSDGKLRKLAEQLGITDLFPAPVNIVWVSC